MKFCFGWLRAGCLRQRRPLKSPLSIQAENLNTTLQNGENRFSNPEKLVKAYKANIADMRLAAAVADQAEGLLKSYGPGNMPPSPPTLGTAPVEGKRDALPMTETMLANLKQAVADLRKVPGKVDTSGIRG